MSHILAVKSQVLWEEENFFPTVGKFCIVTAEKNIKKYTVQGTLY